MLPHESTHFTPRRTALTCALLTLIAACAQQPAAAPEPAASRHVLEGQWERTGDEHPATLTIEGDSLYFYSRPDHQFDTTFAFVPDTDPPELHATILDSPRTSSAAGEVVVALYRVEDGTLSLAVVNADGERPLSFDRASERLEFVRADRAE